MESLVIDNNKMNLELEDLMAIIGQKDSIVINLDAKVKSCEEQIISLKEVKDVMEKTFKSEVLNISLIVTLNFLLFYHFIET